MAIAFVRAYGIGTAADLSNTSITIDTTGLGANGAIAVFIIGGHVAGSMVGKAFSTPTLGGSSTGWTEQIGETINAASNSGMMGAWVCLNPASSASVSLALAWTTAIGVGDRIAAVIALYSGVASNGTAFTADNDGGSTTTDTMTNAPGAGNLTVGAWSHGSAISSVTSGTLRGSILNAATDYSNGCIAFIEGNTSAFSSGSADSNIGLQIELVAVADDGDSTPGPYGPGLLACGPFGPMGFQWRQLFGTDAVVTGSPQTVTAQVADLILSTVAGTVTAGAVTVVAQVATLTLTAIPGPVTAGAVTTTAQIATVTLTPIAGTLVKGGVTVTAQVATLTFTPGVGTVTAGAATVAAQVATATLTAIAGATAGGPVTLAAQTATLTLTAIPGIPSTVGGPQSITAQIATLTLTPSAGVLTTGGITVTAQIATVTLSTVAGTVTAGGVSKTAQIATVTLTTIAGTVTGGPTTITAQVATVTLTGIPGSPSVFGGPQTVTAQIALLALVARAGVLTTGSVTKAAQVAILTLVGVQGTFPGALPPLVPPFAAILTGYEASTANTYRATTRVTQVVTSTVNTTPKSRTVNTTPAGET